MFKPTTVSVARTVASSLALNNMVLTPRAAHYPVGIMASHYAVPSVDRNDESKAIDAFRTVNAEPSERAGEDFDTLTENMAHGLKNMLTVVRQSVVPAVKAVKEQYETVMRGDSGIPKIEVRECVLHEIHMDPVLTQHLAGKYLNASLREEYRTHRVEAPAAETLIEWMASTNHVDDTTVKAWALTVGVEELMDAWYGLFGERRAINAGLALSEARTHYRTAVDQALAAYLITGYLMNEPQDVVGESVSLSEWEGNLANLHTLYGAVLADLYTRRAKYSAQQRLILDVVNAGDSTTIHVNGDVYGAWLEAGGDVKVVLGAGIGAPGITHVADLTERKEALIQLWDRKYYMMRQLAADRRLRDRRRLLKALLVDRSNSGEVTLPEMSYDEVSGHLDAQLAMLSEKDLDDTHRAVARLVCNVYYPNTPYLKFLEAMDRYSQMVPNCDAREAAFTALVEMTAQWLVQQLAVEETRVIHHTETEQVVPDGQVEVTDDEVATVSAQS